MEPIRLGLVGFGRVARSLLRLLAAREDMQVAALADKADPEAIEYLIRFDTLLGRFPGRVELADGSIDIAGRPVRLFSTDKPDEMPWGEAGVEVVIEASSKPRTRADLERHLAAGAKRVILCSPPADPPDLTVVECINGHLLRREQRILSNSSSTAHCAAPVIEVLNEAFGIERLFLTTVHAYSDQQRLADVPEKDMRRGRAAAENVIPQETNAGAMLEELLPALTGKITAMSMNVPVANGSVVDLVAWHSRDVTPEAINQALLQAAGSERYARVLAYETEPIVSSDVASSPFSGTFDSLATMTLGQRMSKTLTWFDNGWGYAHRVIDLVERLAKLDREGA